jgi:glutamate-1-semialdehyde 2,1-aminomutase
VFVDLKADASGWEPRMRASLIGQVQDLLPTTTVIEFNDVTEALESELKRGDIACVLAEPVMTNVGMVRDAPGYLETLRRLCSETGTILVFDETHTISSGYGGHSNLWPAARHDGDRQVDRRRGADCGLWLQRRRSRNGWRKLNASRPAGHSGIGTTLSANALAITAMHAMMGKVITHDAYRHMLALAQAAGEGHRRHDRGAQSCRGMSTNVGARVEFVCAEKPARPMAARRAPRCSPGWRRQSTSISPIAAFCLRRSTI